MTSASKVLPGQVYASIHKGDVFNGVRQRRTVLKVTLASAWLRTEPSGKVSIVQLAKSKNGGSRIPGHRLIEGGE